MVRDVRSLIRQTNEDIGPVLIWSARQADLVDAIEAKSNYPRTALDLSRSPFEIGRREPTLNGVIVIRRPFELELDHNTNSITTPGEEAMYAGSAFEKRPSSHTAKPDVNACSNSRTNLKRLLTVIGVSAFVVTLPLAVSANSLENEAAKSDRTEAVDEATQRQADQLVQEALSNEIYGDIASRNDLLSKALQLSPDHAKARWQLGYVYLDGSWLRLDEVPEKYEADTDISLYLEKRNESEDSVAAQLELAQWCQKRRLFDQEKAHLFRVIQLAPNHVDARLRLGFRRLNDEWIAGEDILNELQEAAETRNAFEKWQSAISAIQTQLHRTNLSARSRGERELLNIHDAEAIPAIEAILLNDDEEIALLGVNAISQMESLKASETLARHAVFNRSSDVRRLAALELRQRDKMEYVPQLLAEMNTPFRTISQVIPGRGRRLVHRTVYLQEDQDSRRALVDDTQYHRVAPIGDSQQTWDRVQENMSVRSGQVAVNVRLQNLQIGQLNERICETLRLATEQDLPSQPQVWWDWWNADNDLLIEGSKTLLTSYQSREFDVFDTPSSRPANAQTTTATVSPQPQRRSYECLIRGTLVWTASGAQPIESIQVGDLVLAKEVESGELAFRPVLRTTQRPSGPLMRIELHGETICSSLGHPFWVSGEGWVKAKDLESGMELHSVDGCVRISEVTKADPEETFNLVVDGFASYFVGESKVLSHDHTMPEPSTRVVPGLQE